MKTMLRPSLFAAAALLCATTELRAQPQPLTTEQKEKRWQTERELQSLAVVERKILMPMRDGVRVATDVYRPKNASGKVLKRELRARLAEDSPGEA